MSRLLIYMKFCIDSFVAQMDRLYRRPAAARRRRFGPEQRRQLKFSACALLKINFIFGFLIGVLFLNEHAEKHVHQLHMLSV